jgi:uncharacterized protein involved in type VI secretion and phage assembly
MNQFLEFLEKLKTVGPEWFRRYYSTYPAIVVDNNDPEKRGRIKFKCPVVFGQYIHPIWAEPCESDLAGKDSGKFDPPYVGQWVNIQFEFGDTRSPVYSGGFFAKDELASEFKTNYPNVRGWAWKSGQRLIIDETENSPKVTVKNADGSYIDMDGKSGSENITIKHKSGATIIIDKSGNILLSDKDGKDSIAVKSGEIDIVSNGKVNVSGKADLTINGDGVAKFSGKGGTTVGSGYSATQVDGSSVALAGGGVPIAVVGKKAIGQDSHGVPVVSTIISGSQKVTSG